MMSTPHTSRDAHYSARCVSSRSDWNTYINWFPDRHLLQSWDWGEFKSRHGWLVQRLIWEESGKLVAAAQILERKERHLGINANLMYAPRGPLLDWSDGNLRERVLRDLRTLANKSGVLFIKIDPEVPSGHGIPDTLDARPDQVGTEVSRWLPAHGWRYSNEQIQLRNTVLLDLTCSEDDLIGSFKQKTRYNIRLATKKGTAVRSGTLDDVNMLYQMYAGTSARDGFVIRESDYYLDLWRSFMNAGVAQPLIAEVAGEPAAAAIIFSFGDRAFYLYGMSRNVHREKMPNYLLQWEAMRWAKSQGCRSYDMWGAPEVFAESDEMWGVWRFKSGFRGEVLRTIGAWDLPIHRIGYKIYTSVTPRILGIMRWRRMRTLLPNH